MKQVRDIFQASVSFLRGKKIPNPQRSVEDLLAAALCTRRMDVYLAFDRPMSMKEVDVFRSYIARRARGEPVEYILGFVSFFEMKLKVNKNVLIPRPETELLIHFVKNWCSAPSRILDVCTGSGCIALATKQVFPNAEVVATDISPEALNIAKENAAFHSLDIDFRKGDFLEPISNEKFDLIISNPPYISKKEYEILDPVVRNYEPKEALIGGEDGLDFYKKFAIELPKICMRNAKIIFEIGHTQQNALSTLFSHSLWKKQGYERDWSGRDRFFFLEYADETR